MVQAVSANPSQIAHDAPSLARQAGLTVAATGLVALAAHVSVPLFFTPVPITLQTLAVLFLGLLMGPRWAFVTMTLYLAEGAAGLPVFSPYGPGGVLQLFGFTGGYLLSYPFAAALAGLLYRSLRPTLKRSFTGRDFVAAFSSAFLASALILTSGALWLATQTHAPARAVLAHAVLPFLPGDLAKVCLAASAIIGVNNARHREDSDSVA
ncbi:MAG TPA: biotin transporter BioY [Acidisarcina sp.]